MNSLRPYPRYKPSGVPWLGDVPEGWSLLPGRACYWLKSESNKGMQESTVLSLSYGRVIVKPPEKLHGLVPASFETYQVVEPGDIVCRPTDLQNDQTSLRFGLARDLGIITSAYLCFHTQACLAREFGFLMLHAYDLKKVFYGLGSGLRQNLDWPDFKYLPCVAPPVTEQTAIARYLDHVDRRIRKYIRAKQKQIALLTEQTQAIIDQEVEGRHYADSSLAPTSVPWLARTPSHWSGMALKRCLATRITDGPHETPSLLDAGVPFLSAEAIVDGRFDFSHARGYISREAHETYCMKCRPAKDDVFMCKSGATTGKLAMVEDDTEFSVWSPLALIRADRRRAAPPFLLYALRSSYVQAQVQQTWSAGTQPNLSMPDMGRLFLAMPPPDEQLTIVRRIEDATSTLDAAAEAALRQIASLREYRTRLVADVVTGKLDVREAAANLPDEEPEEPEVEVEEEPEEMAEDAGGEDEGAVD